MHFWASIEHSLKYKYQKNIPLDLKERLYHVAITGAKLDDEMTTLHHLIQEYDSLSDDGNNNDPLEEEINMNSLKRW